MMRFILVFFFIISSQANALDINLRPKPRPLVTDVINSVDQINPDQKKRLKTLQSELLKALMDSEKSDSQPFMSRDDLMSFQQTVQRCWNTLDKSVNFNLTIGFSLSEVGKVIPGSFRLIRADSPLQQNIDAAYTAARQTIIRCQKEGFDLPREQYAQWKELEITFVQEKMKVTK